jgi:hypothetical protein
LSAVEDWDVLGGLSLGTGGQGKSRQGKQAGRHRMSGVAGGLAADEPDCDAAWIAHHQ